MTAGRAMPAQDDVLGYFDTLSNWGRWGDDDVPVRRRHAGRRGHAGARIP